MDTQTRYFRFCGGLGVIDMPVLDAIGSPIMKAGDVLEVESIKHGVVVRHLSRVGRGVLCDAAAQFGLDGWWAERGSRPPRPITEYPLPVIDCERCAP